MTLPKDKTKIEDYLKKLSFAKKGKKQTEQHKINSGRGVQKWWDENKNSDVVKERNKKLSLKLKGKVSHNKGKKLSLEKCKVISEAKRKKYNGYLFNNPKERALKISNALIGKKQSEEHRKKNSEGHKGISSGNKGKKASLETKKKNSISHINYYKKHPEMIKHLKSFTGEKASNWQGGKSFEPYPKNFNYTLKNKIRKRDNYKCKHCNISQKKLIMKDRFGKLINYSLDAHHIDRNKENNKENNLISLCHKCHSKLHFNKKEVINNVSSY